MAATQTKERIGRSVEGVLGLDDLEKYPEFTVLRKNWGTPLCPATKRDYLIPIEFVGGVARHVPREVVKAWLGAPRLKDLLYVLSPEATESDFIRATGVEPIDAERFVAMLTGYDMEKIKAVMGDEKLLEIAERMKALVAGGGKGKP